MAFDKLTLQNLANKSGGVSTNPFYTFYASQGETVLFIIKTSDIMGYFTIFEDQLHSANIKDDQSWAFSETVQKISKITYTASGFSLLSNLQCELWRMFECLNKH